MTSGQFKMLMYMPKTFLPGFINDLFHKHKMHIVTNYYIFSAESIVVNYRVCVGIVTTSLIVCQLKKCGVSGANKNVFRGHLLASCFKETHTRNSVVTVFQARNTYCDLCVAKSVVEFLTRDQCIEREHSKESSDEEW